MKNRSTLTALWVAVGLAVGYTPASARSAAHDPSPVGRWAGNIGVADEAIEMFIDIDRGADGTLIGEIDIPAQGLEGFPVDVQLDGSQLILELTGVEWHGELSTDGSRYSGTLQQEPRPDVSFSLQRVGEPQISAELRAMTDPGQVEDKKVRTLSADARELREQFNQDRGKVRLLLLLSPS